MTNSIFFSILVSLLLCLNQGIIAQQKLSGKVVKVIDGDTFDLLHSNYTLERIRLADIDAPEKGQDFGKASKDFLLKLIISKQVQVTFDKRDRNKRVIGTVYVGNVYVNMTMVQEGMAWHFLKYSQDQRFAQAQIVAKKQKRGIWIQPNPLSPWDYRKMKRKN